MGKAMDEIDDALDAYIGRNTLDEEPMTTTKPTSAESPEQIAERLLPCVCLPDYKLRNLTQPDCPRCNYADDVAAALRAERERATCPLHSSEQLREFVIDMRGIRGELCKNCDGWGTYAYPSTATWRGGIGGQMFTSDVCDKCWGSGDATYPWPDRRALAQKGGNKSESY